MEEQGKADEGLKTMEVEQWGLLPPIEPEHFFSNAEQGMAKQGTKQYDSMVSPSKYLAYASSYIDLFMNSEARVCIRLIAKN